MWQCSVFVFLAFEIVGVVLIVDKRRHLLRLAALQRLLCNAPVQHFLDIVERLAAGAWQNLPHCGRLVRRPMVIRKQFFLQIVLQYLFGDFILPGYLPIVQLIACKERSTKGLRQCCAILFFTT